MGLQKQVVKAVDKNYAQILSTAFYCLYLKIILAIKIHDFSLNC